MSPRRYPPRVTPRNGSTRAWRKVRQQVLVRDGHTCQECGHFPANHVDHITPRSMGGSDKPSNLRVLCATCNLKGG